MKAYKKMLMWLAAGVLLTAMPAGPAFAEESPYQTSVSMSVTQVQQEAKHDNVYLTVTDTNGNAIPEAELWIYTNEKQGSQLYGLTEANGIVSVRMAAAGEYQYQIQKRGYYSVNGRFQVTDVEGRTSVRIRMSRISGGGSSGGGSTGESRRKKPASLPTGQWKLGTGGWYFVFDRTGLSPENQWEKLMWNNEPHWFLFDTRGFIRSGWTEWKGEWYYLHPLHDGRFGEMETGWSLIDGKYYYFSPAADKKTGALYEKKPEGSMWKDADTPDGYHVGADGAWKVAAASK